MKKQTEYIVEAPAPLLDYLFVHLTGLSRNSVKHILSRGQVLVEHTPQRQFDYPLAPGQVVTVLPQARGAQLPFPVLYEDDALIAIDKPSGLLSVSTESERDRTAFRITSDYVRSRDPGQRLWVVHRLDRDTSGVLLFAKSPGLRDALQEQWNSLVSQREYLALAEGEDIPDSGVCRSSLRQSKAYKVYSSGDDRGKEAVTRYETLARRGGLALLRVELDTGRKNQIRVHLSELGHPVAGDKKYGAASDPIRRLALHASKLSLKRPDGAGSVTISSPAPAEYMRLFPVLRHKK